MCSSLLFVGLSSSFLTIFHAVDWLKVVNNLVEDFMVSNLYKVSSFALFWGLIGYALNAGDIAFFKTIGF
jgi:hypothetical protein